MKPFSDISIKELIADQNKRIIQYIESLEDEEIMANDLAVLIENIYQTYFIETVTIYDEDISKREIIRGKVRKGVDTLYEEGYKRGREVDGVVVEVHYPYKGERDLFRCQTSDSLSKKYPRIDLYDGDIVFKVSKSNDELKGAGKNKLLEGLTKALIEISEGIECVNSVICEFNGKIKLDAWKLLNKKKEDIELFFEVAKVLKIQMEKKEYAQKIIPIQRRVIPITHEYDKEEYYNLKDTDYRDILDAIKHTGSTYERTPYSYRFMQEEDLRNTILATLNAIYKGDATGESFRNNGKTDICIERENRAAFVAECKMWTGQKALEKAIYQLDSYLTWRDCKTALIYFVKQKDFIQVIDKAKEALNKAEGINSVKELDKNEFECKYISKNNIGQIIKIRVMLFNLFSKGIDEKSDNAKGC